MSAFNWQYFLEDVFCQRYVLVVGNEVALSDEYNNGDSLEYLYDNYDLQRKQSRDLEYNEFVSDFHIDETCINTSLKQLLSYKIFRIIITTTTDDLLERILREIWGDELRVLNFYGDEFDINESYTQDEFYETKPILYYAFGKATSGGRFVDDKEDSKLKVVADWLNFSRDKFPINIYTYLSSKKMITLGCKQDDWLFRFFWYSLRQNVKDLRTGEEAKGKIAIEFNEEDKRLKRYLKNKGWLYDGNARVFIEDFLKQIKLNSENETMKFMLLNSTSGGCFISYASEDFDYALHLYLALTRAGYKVWLDNYQLYPGADYESRIKNAISEEGTEKVPFL